MNLNDLVLTVIGEVLERDPDTVAAWDATEDLGHVGLDSLATVEMIDRLELVTGVEIDPGADAARLTSLAGIEGLLAEKLRK